MNSPPVIVARQPICNREREVEGYELLFRAHDRDRALVTDPDQATAHVLVTSFADIGARTLVGGRSAWINVSRRFLLDVDPLPIGPQGVVLELLEDQVVDRQLIDRCVQLRQAGYSLALDDFRLTPETERLVSLASIVKVDVRAEGVEGAARQVAALDGFRGKLLAEKVEDEEEFARCLELGFDLFQGWFFCRPELVEGRPLSTSALDAMRSAATLSTPELSFDDLERIVSHDPALTVRLLRLLNSAAFPTARRIATVHEALVMLGERTVRQWAMLIILAGLPATCDELVPTALIRARLLERLAAERGDAAPDGAFVVGLFSVVDALLGCSMETVLEDLPLAEEHVAALVHHRGPNGQALGAALAHERGEDWAAGAVAVDPERFGSVYMDAVEWAMGCAPGLAAD
jgi:EAL and modified HD-GYP domain-containing signal transduction protein